MSAIVNKYNNLPDLCFFFPRHVRKSIHKDIWKECLKGIRKNYPTEQIFIIDDNSDKNLIDEFDNELIWMMNNVNVINSAFPGAGELLPFYYFHLLKPAKKAVFISDSMFIQKPFDKNIIDNLQDVRFLWHFGHSSEPLFAVNTEMNDNKIYYFFNIMHSLLQNLNYNNDLINLFNSTDWVGCFAASCIINLNFMDILVSKYNFLKLLNFIVNRDMRQMLERIFALVVLFELQNKPNIKDSISIFGDIWYYQQGSFTFSFDDYKNTKLDLPIVKCWNSR